MNETFSFKIDHQSAFAFISALRSSQMFVFAGCVSILKQTRSFTLIISPNSVTILLLNYFQRLVVANR